MHNNDSSFLNDKNIIKEHFTSSKFNGGVFNDPDFYEIRDSLIQNDKGDTIFEQKNIEIPKSWSTLASDIIASKYLKRASVPTPDGKETSAKQPINRIANTISKEGIKLRYFSEEESEIFNKELKEILVTQRAAFNSPVWFNCGLYHEYNIEHGNGTYYYDPKIDEVLKTTSDYIRPQVSACFIQSIEDSIEGITDLVKAEAQLFKFGSGTGTNFSNIRGKGEFVSGGGKASGVMSFLKILDANAGAVKSGGISRRAAKMVVLDIDHPEIMDFIEFKAKEEKKAHVLIAAGYDSHYEGEAYTTINGQNANNSISVSDKFMQCVKNNNEFSTTFRTSGKIAKTYKAKDMLMAAAQAAWECADPGIQFNDTMNNWNTCSVSGKIRSSNPCGEFLHLDDTACNLASLNLIKFVDIDTGNFDIESYIHTIKIIILAQEILCAIASYPTKKIARNAYKFRELGIGHANIGGLLMQLGIPYDSDEGRTICALLTSILSGYGYFTSSIIAENENIGPFEAYNINKNSMMNVIFKHHAEAKGLDQDIESKSSSFSKYPLFNNIINDLIKPSLESWRNCTIANNGFRNSQISTLAPTGTIGLLMDCDTTGIEPDFSLVKYKKLSGGGNIKIVNQSIENALLNLGYNSHIIKGIKEYILQNDTIEGCNLLFEEHLPVFDCANKSGDGTRYLKPESHLYMMAAAQPFISGGISKTINIPNNSTVEDIYNLYMLAYDLHLKCVAVYRDGCKQSQPLNTSKDKVQKDNTKLSEEEIQILRNAIAESNTNLNNNPIRKRLPNTRKGLTTEATIEGHKIYIRTGEYEDGTLGEIFLDMAKEGSILKAFLNAWAIAVSKGLQYGIPLQEYFKTFEHFKFDPQGWVKHDKIKSCTSIIDFVIKWIKLNYDNKDTSNLQDSNIASDNTEHINKDILRVIEAANVFTKPTFASDAPVCTNCGHLTIRNGSCFKCTNCGTSLGCS